MITKYNYWFVDVKNVLRVIPVTTYKSLLLRYNREPAGFFEILASGLLSLLCI